MKKRHHGDEVFSLRGGRNSQENIFLSRCSIIVCFVTFFGQWRHEEDMKFPFIRMTKYYKTMCIFFYYFLRSNIDSLLNNKTISFRDICIVSTFKENLWVAYSSCTSNLRLPRENPFSSPTSPV